MSEESQLSIKKTVGLPSNTRPGEKDYRIYLSNGDSFLAEKCSINKYVCNGFEGRIKDIKQNLCEGGDGPQEDVILFEANDPSWSDCIDPCALLTIAYQHPAIKDKVGSQILNTLNHYGWLSHPEEKTLVDRALKEWDRIEEKKSKVSI